MTKNINLKGNIEDMIVWDSISFYGISTFVDYLMPKPSFSKKSSGTQFLPGSGHIDTAIWVHYMDANKTAGEEARRQLQKNAACNLEQVLAATPHKTPTVRPPASYHENYSS